MMNILVTGANGQLGNHMRLLAEKSDEHNWSFVDVDELDLTQEAAVWSYFRHYPVDVVVNCAAYTNVDRAEEEEAVADRVNHLAVRYLAEAAKASDALLVHISTDYVFGGNVNNTPCTERQSVNPTGAYGRTKLAGERAIQEVGCRYVIIRTAWLYSEYGRNFVKTMQSLIASRPELKVVFDQVGTPTYAGDLAAAILQIIHRAKIPFGIYHYSNEGVCSWYDFAQAIARQMDNAQCHILPCHSSEFPSPVVRPSYSVLDKTLIKQTFGLEIPYWTDSLARCMQQMAQ